MALASSYTVSGTGTAFDGIYTPNGNTQNSTAVYQNGTGHYLYMSYNGQTFDKKYRWGIDGAANNTDDTSDMEYYDGTNSSSPSGVPNPDVGTWHVGNGSGSAPTVTAGTLVTNKTRGAALFF